MFLLDSHCDTPSHILRLRDLALDNRYSHVDFPKLRRGGVDGAFFALYTPASLSSDESYAYACRLLDGVRGVLAAHPDKARLATTPEEAYANKADGVFSVFLGLENGQALDRSLERVDEFYDAGVRYITLCHSKNNQICDSCAQGDGWNGLSPFGRDVVRKMNSLGMLVDVSHISDASFYDVLETSDKPVVATHSCCRALCDHPRNMTDEMIRHLAEAGGVIQINFYPLFLDGSFKSILNASGIMEYGERIESEFIADPANPEKRAAWNKVQDELEALQRPSYKLIADHIDHVVDLVGIDHVGLGSDYDGIEVTPLGMEDISMMPVLFDELRFRGYTDSDLSKIASDNFFRIL
jgi:membrane dipeptidase